MELKIRLWDELKNKMWHPENIATIDIESKCVWIKQQYKGGHWVYFNKAKILQYTGLKDKNGKDIYEGDIIRNSRGTILNVLFVDGSFYAEGTDALSKQYAFAILSDFSSWSEVIGNLYENQELLGESE